jgi:hypothetical protein
MVTAAALTAALVTSTSVKVSVHDKWRYLGERPYATPRVHQHMCSLFQPRESFFSNEALVGAS